MKKPISIIAVIIVAVLILPPLVVPMFSSWSEINCHHEEINIKTGRARYTRMLWFIKVSEKMKDTPLSTALHGEAIDVNNIKAWQRVNTFSPGLRHSPHYSFHGAFAQARELEMILERYNATDVLRKDATVGLLTTWQESGNDHAAGEYLNNVKKQLEQDNAADFSIATQS